jgi:flagellar motor switch/type III secretory pathway protein FliN
VIAALRFDRTGRPGFEPATNVRLETVCSVANAVREHLSRLLGREVSIDVFEPTFVPLGSQPALFSKARVFLAHAHRCDLLVVLRERDARRLTACAFREELETIGERELSALEEQVLERLGRELAGLCAPLCGEVTSYGPANGPVDRYECATYFELRLGSPVDAVIGLGLSKDPAPPSGLKVAPADLAAVEVEVVARVARTRMPARSLAALRVGSVVRFDTALEEPASLRVGHVTVAKGTCGVRRDRLAFNVTTAATRRSA